MEEHKRRVRPLESAVTTPSPGNISAGRKEGVLTCLECGETAGTKFHLRKHSETNLEGFSYICPNCCKLEFGPKDVEAEKLAYPVEDISGNISEDSGFEDFLGENCKEIKFEISPAETVWNDIKLEGSGRAAPDCNTAPCDDCEKVLTTKWNVKEHRNSVHNGIRFLCNQCDCIMGPEQNLEADTASYEKS